MALIKAKSKTRTSNSDVAVTNDLPIADGQSENKHASANDRSLESILSLVSSVDVGELEKFISLSKDKKEGLFNFAFTNEGERIDAEYRRAFKLAEEKGPRDREVVKSMAAIGEEWPSYPGVIENLVNDALEANKTHEALQIAERAMSKWSSLLKKNGVSTTGQFQTSSAGNIAFVQVLANYEFALERSEALPRALEMARIAMAVDPSDPESLMSSVVSLAIRTGDPDAALTELDAMPESIAPYALYGRALAYFALHQYENAGTAVQTALRYWPAVAQGVGREWRGGLSLPKPGEGISDSQILYGYYEVFGSAWKSVEGALEWLRSEEKKFIQSGARQQQYVGLTRTGQKTDGRGNVVTLNAANEARLSSARIVGEDTFHKLLAVGTNEYVYALTDAGKAQEEKLTAIYKQDLKYHDRIDKIQALSDEWPGHANAAIALARFLATERKFERAVDLLERPIFALQSFWPDDLVGKGKIEVEWESNKPLLNAYAHIILDCAEGGEIDAARKFADDYIAINPKDTLGVRQKAIELALLQSDTAAALAIIEPASDPVSAHHLFGKALALFMSGKKEEATMQLHAAIKSRPKIYREYTSEKHRMPPNYNPAFVAYYSNEEAYNYWMLWSSLWRNTLGALAWLRAEGKKV